jgi:hypothetical protein
MRRAPNAMLMTREIQFEFSREAETESRSNETTDSAAALALDVDAARVEVLRGAKRLVDDLSHDARQPLSSMSMNLESAIRCLRAPEPRVSAALEALTECLDMESEMVVLLTMAQRFVAEELAECLWFSLNELAEVMCTGLLTLEQDEPDRIALQLAKPQPHVGGDSWPLRIGFLTIARQLLMRADHDSRPSASNPLIIETRWAGDRAELRLSGIRSRTVDDDIESILQCAQGFARLSRGAACFEVGRKHSAVVISLPARAATRRVAFDRRSNGT